MTTLFRLGSGRQQRNAWDRIAERYADRAPFRIHAGEPVNDDTAMRLGAVWGCVDLISELVSTLPVDEFRKVNGVATPQGSRFLRIRPVTVRGSRCGRGR